MKNLFLIILVFIISGSIIDTTLETPSAVVEQNNGLVPVTQWIPSNDLPPDYNRGKFYYRFYRKQLKSGYMFEIHFISDSYYSYPMYQDEEVYRASTKIDQVILYVDGAEHINELVGSSRFWLVFNGDFELGIGDPRVRLYTYNPEPSIVITWSQPIPF